MKARRPSIWWVQLEIAAGNQRSSMNDSPRNEIPSIQACGWKFVNSSIEEYSDFKYSESLETRSVAAMLLAARARRFTPHPARQF
ncbi:MAG: hypothetical protein JRH01_17750 [Deltaproteobacteria bacterium]|nr:hypothetical protein [Deltaproteobacteria bacterium]MBW2395540.1 hypothetical protein [Deltaproteobacteria bacterium]